MTQSTDQGTIWLTQEAFDKLHAELDDLKGPRRQEIIERISAARDEGDLKENGGYHAAKDEQGKVEARIRQLEDMLRRAEVGETPENDGVVEPGMVVTYRFVGDDETEKFLLGAREIKREDDPLEVYSPQSAMGAAINGKSKGDTVSYTAPNGKELSVEIVDAVPYTRLTHVFAAGVSPRRRRLVALSGDALLGLLVDPVAPLAEPGQHLLGVRLAAGLHLDPHLDLVEVQRRRDPLVGDLEDVRAGLAELAQQRWPGRPGGRGCRRAGRGSDRRPPCRAGSPCRAAAGRCCRRTAPPPRGSRTRSGGPASRRPRPRRPARRPSWRAPCSASSACDSDSSETVRMSSTWSRTAANVISPGSPTAMPSAIVFIDSSLTGAPCASEPGYAAAPSACTPTTRTSGRIALIAIAIPASSPPPPVGHHHGLHVGRLLEDLEARGALAGHDVDVVEGVDQHRAGLARRTRAPRTRASSR